MSGGAREKINYVYTQAQQQEIAEISELLPDVYGADDILAGKLAETEVIFATWGMPALTAEMMDKMPKLQAIFYGAGATDSFARACFARNVKVFSAWQANAIPVAEFCLAQILLGLKGYFRYVRTLNCKERFNHQLAGPGCYGEKVALIGAGAILPGVSEPNSIALKLFGKSALSFSRNTLRGIPSQIAAKVLPSYSKPQSRMFTPSSRAKIALLPISRCASKGKCEEYTAKSASKSVLNLR